MMMIIETMIRTMPVVGLMMMMVEMMIRRILGGGVDMEQDLSEGC